MLKGISNNPGGFLPKGNQARVSGAGGISHYWVGGTGNTNDTAHWSLASGGTGGASVPIAGVNAAWDGSSGGGTATFNAVFVCKNFNCTGYTGTLAGSSARTVGGSYTFGSGMAAVSMTGTTTLNSTALGNLVTTNGKLLLHTLTFNGVGGGWTLADNITTSGNIILTNGTLDYNSKTVAGAALSAAAGTTINISNSTINCTTWSVTATTTINSANSTINCGPGTFGGGDKSYNVVNFALSTTPIVQMTGSNSFINLSLTNTAAYAGMSIGAGTTQTISGLLTLTGNNASTQRQYVRSVIAGATSSFLINGTISISNVDFEGIIVTGTAAPITGPLLGDCGRNSGITFATPITTYYIAPAATPKTPMDANWFTTSGGATPARIPLPQDIMRFDANSFSTTGKTVAFNVSGGSGRFGAQDWTGATNSPTADFTVVCNFYGSMTFISGMTLTGNNIQVIAGDRTMTFTSAGKTIPFGLNVNCVGGSLTLQDNYTASQSMTHSGGLFDWNDKNLILTAGSFTTSGSLVRRLDMGAGTVELQSTGTLWTASGTNLTLNPETSTIKYTNSSASTKIFAGGGFTYNKLWNATASTGTFTISGSNTFATFQSDASRTTIITAGTTQSINTLTLGNTCTIQSSGSTYTIANTSGVAFASIGTVVSNCTCTGAGWIVTSGTDGGGNTGITFI